MLVSHHQILEIKCWELERKIQVNFQIAHQNQDLGQKMILNPFAIGVLEGVKVHSTSQQRDLTMLRTLTKSQSLKKW
jgi:hypothetical protein